MPSCSQTEEQLLLTSSRPGKSQQIGRQRSEQFEDLTPPLNTETKTRSLPYPPTSFIFTQFLVFRTLSLSTTSNIVVNVDPTNLNRPRRQPHFIIQNFDYNWHLAKQEEIFGTATGGFEFPISNFPAKHSHIFLLKKFESLLFLMVKQRPSCWHVLSHFCFFNFDSLPRCNYTSLLWIQFTTFALFLFPVCDKVMLLFFLFGLWIVVLHILHHSLCSILLYMSGFFVWNLTTVRAGFWVCSLWLGGIWDPFVLFGISGVSFRFVNWKYFCCLFCLYLFIALG